MKQTLRFTGSNNTSLHIVARTGKTGISIFARARTAGQKAVIGSRNVFLPAHEAQATERFNALVADAEAKGWTRKAAGAGVTASHFSELPTPDAMPVGASLVAKTAKPAKPVAVPPKTNGNGHGKK